jgi:DnaJ homolog subfamily C member 3
VSCDPAHYVYFSFILKALLDAEKFQEAVNTFHKAVEVAPDNSEEKQRASKRLQNAQVALKQSKEKNYYKILGVSRTASAKEIKAAYRKLALQWCVLKIH